MLDWNQHLFLLLNAPISPPHWLVAGVATLADSPMIVVPMLLVGLWIWGVPDQRGALLAIAGTTVLAQGANVALGLVWFEPRPFMVPVGRTLIAHVADNGFPSDHATLVWTLGAGLLLTKAAPRWGVVVCLYGGAVAWSRIWLGVHFPDDMVVSAFVGVTMGSLARAVRPSVSRSILPVVDMAYEGVLSMTRMPPALIPRRSWKKGQVGVRARNHWRDV